MLPIRHGGVNRFSLDDCARPDSDRSIMRLPFAMRERQSHDPRLA
jgi:hypothetical protein